MASKDLQSGELNNMDFVAVDSDDDEYKNSDIYNTLGCLKERKKYLRMQNTKVTIKKNITSSESDSFVRSMVYRSRTIIPGGQITKTPKEKWAAALSKAMSSSSRSLDKNGHNSSMRLVPLNLDPRHQSSKVASSIALRMCCAESLYKISCQIGSEESLVSSGSIETLISYADESNDELEKYIVTIIANILTETAVYDEVVKRNGLSAILELSWCPDEEIKLMSCISLCRLSIKKEHVQDMINAHAVTEILALAMQPNLILRQMALKVFSNLIYYGFTFPEKIFAGKSVHAQDGIIGVMHKLCGHEMEECVYLLLQVCFNISCSPKTAINAVYGGLMDIIKECAHHLVQTSSISSHPESKLWCLEGLINCCNLVDLSIQGPQIVGLFLSDPSLDIRILCLRLLILFSKKDSSREYCCKQMGIILILIDLLKQHSDHVLIQELAMESISNFAVDFFGSNELIQHGFIPYLVSILSCSQINSQINLSTLNTIRSLLMHPVSVEGFLKSNFIQQILTLYHREVKDSSHHLIQHVCQTVLCNTTCLSLLIPFNYSDEIILILIDGFNQVKDDISRQTKLMGGLAILSSTMKQSSTVQLFITLCKDILLIDKERATCLNSVIPDEWYANLSIILSNVCILFPKDSNLSFLLNNQELQSIYNRLDQHIISSSSKDHHTNEMEYYLVRGIYALCYESELHIPSYFIQLMAQIVCRSHHLLTLKECGAAFAQFSCYLQGKKELSNLHDMDKILNVLGRSIDPRCQYHAAITACNIATYRSIWNHSTLEGLIAITLLRTNSRAARQVYAKGLVNLLSHPSIRNELVHSRVIYALLKLTQLSDENNNLKTQHICLQGLYNLSVFKEMQIILFEQGIINIINEFASNKIKMDTLGRRYFACTLCNLSFYTKNHKRLLLAPTLDAIVRICHQVDIETRTACAMMLRNFSTSNDYNDLFCTKTTLQLLTTFSNSKNAILTKLALQALGNLMCWSEALPIMNTLKLHRIILKSNLNPFLSNDLISSILSIWHNVALYAPFIGEFPSQKIIFRLEMTVKMFTKKNLILTVQLLRVLSQYPSYADQFVYQGIVELCHKIYQQFHFLLKEEENNNNNNHKLDDKKEKQQIDDEKEENDEKQEKEEKEEKEKKEEKQEKQEKQEKEEEENINITKIDKECIQKIKENETKIIKKEMEEENDFMDLYRNIFSILSNLSSCRGCHLKFLSSGVFEFYCSLCNDGMNILFKNDSNCKMDASIIAHNLSIVLRFQVIQDDIFPLLPSFLSILGILLTKSCYETLKDYQLCQTHVACALLNLTTTDSLREYVEEDHGIDLLIQLGKEGDETIKKCCAMALHRFAVRESKQLKHEAVEILLKIMSQKQSDVASIELFVETVSQPTEWSRHLPQVKMSNTKLCKPLFLKYIWSKKGKILKKKIIFEMIHQYNTYGMIEFTKEEMNYFNTNHQHNLSIQPTLMTIDLEKRTLKGHYLNNIKVRHSLTNVMDSHHLHHHHHLSMTNEDNSTYNGQQLTPYEKKMKNNRHRSRSFNSLLSLPAIEFALQSARMMQEEK